MYVVGLGFIKSLVSKHGFPNTQPIKSLNTAQRFVALARATRPTDVGVVGVTRPTAHARVRARRGDDGTRVWMRVDARRRRARSRGERRASRGGVDVVVSRDDEAPARRRDARAHRSRGRGGGKGSDGKGKKEKNAYGVTVRLPKTTFEMRANSVQRNLHAGVVARVWGARRYGPLEMTPFTLHDGPPYANGDLHIGHALNKILKGFCPIGGR